MKGERDQTLDKYEQNEIMWDARNKKTQATSSSLLEMNQGLKDDNQELMMQVDKYIKRVRQVENEVEREKENCRATELKLHDERRNVQNLQDQLQDEKANFMKAQKRVLELQLQAEQDQ